MSTFWHKTQYFLAIILLASALSFSAVIFSSPPSLAYLAIFYSSTFALILTLMWRSRFSKTIFGKTIFTVNSIICAISIGSLLKEDGDFEDYTRMINCLGNSLAALITLFFGIIHFKKMRND
jgi:hypothetical protein